MARTNDKTTSLDGALVEFNDIVEVTYHSGEDHTFMLVLPNDVRVAFENGVAQVDAATANALRSAGYVK